MGAVWRAWFNRCRRALWQAMLWRRVFGERSAAGRWLAHTRISPSSCIEGWASLDLGDHVFIGHFNLIDASAGVRLGEGVQISHHVMVITHSTHRSIRLNGRVGAGQAGPRVGDVRAPVDIGAYSFIGPFSVIEPGTVLGRGSLVCSHSRVRGHFPDFAVLAGQPAVVVGDTRERDAPWLAAHPEVRGAYQAWASEAP